MIVVALVNNISGNKETQNLTKEAVNAFNHSIALASQNFNVDSERDFIVSKIIESFNTDDEEIIEASLTCLRIIFTE